MACPPRPLEPPLRVRVPGSTSNLGPGFDLLGLALSLFLEVRLRAGAAGGEAGSPPALLARAFERAAHELGVAARPYRFEVRSAVPAGRGFGSSGALVAAGLLLARALAPRAVELERCLAWGIELEGHPDNVTASLFGGCTLCHPDPDGRPAWIEHPLHPSLGFALAWPPDPLSTERARAALPERVPYADAVENPRRLALLLEGLRTGEPRLLSTGVEERLHVARRLELVPGAARALEAAREAGAFAATISGAGSGLVAIGARGRMAGVAEAMAAAFRDHAGGGEGRVVEPVTGTPRVERLVGQEAG